MLAVTCRWLPPTSHRDFLYEGTPALQGACEEGRAQRPRARDTGRKSRHSGPLASAPSGALAPQLPSKSCWGHAGSSPELPSTRENSRRDRGLPRPDHT